jgi:hypothetical protein
VGRLAFVGQRAGRAKFQGNGASRRRNVDRRWIRARSGVSTDDAKETLGTLHERGPTILRWRHGDRSDTQSARELVRARRPKPATKGWGIGRLQLAIGGPERHTIRSGQHERLGDAELYVLSQPGEDVEASGSASQDIEVWGTGSASREVRYVEDGAQLIALAAEPHDGGEPAHLGAGAEIQIRKSFDLIAGLAASRVESARTRRNRTGSRDACGK